MNIIEFSDISISDLSLVGGKNASLGEMFNKLAAAGVSVPDGFAITAGAYREFLRYNLLEEKLREQLGRLDRKNFENLAVIGMNCRKLITDATIPIALETDILAYFDALQKRYDHPVTVAVRSSATTEDLPNASFAGQHDSFLNIHRSDLVVACRRCYASLFNDRAIKYRVQMNFDHLKTALSVGVQIMVRSDLGASGVAFTIDPETGFKNMVYVTGVWGLGENIVQGAVTPDEFFLFKPSLRSLKKSLITRKCGEKSHTLIFSNSNSDTVNVATSLEKQGAFVLGEAELGVLGRWCMAIEEHYKAPMDIEWAKDGMDGKLYVVQARPETVHHGKKAAPLRTFQLTSRGKLITSGKAVGKSIVSGIARIISDPKDGHKLREGEVLITNVTSPDWNAVLKKASVIVTNKGGRTSHASIVARELGLCAVVGTINGTELIKDGEQITVSCAEGDVGKIYAGKLDWQEKEVEVAAVRMPQTAPMLILADPSRALEASLYPSMGVGLLRMEFIITGSVQVHPMALAKFSELKEESVKKDIELLTRHYSDKTDYFTDQLSQGIAMIAAAFFPREVIVRMSDFKTNEYAGLLGGKQFEPCEENPMIGFRGASRYYHERYKPGFALECKAIKIVRDDMGLTNIKLMVPFCRTVNEGRKVLDTMAEFGLVRGQNELEVYMMAEIPSNVIQADEFARIFDGFSIGSNDLTQLTLGIDRDSEIVSHLFSEKDPAAMWMISTVIKKANLAQVKIGLCGQAASDYPDFAQFLVEQGIHSISFNIGALLDGIENINKAEMKVVNN